MSKIYFSLQEANEMIYKIKKDIEKIEQLKEELELLDNTRIEFEEEKVENYLLEVEINKNFHEKSLALYSVLGDLIKQGCIVRDFEDIEIDFYSKLENKDIVFCWSPGQDKILYWHYPGEDRKKKREIREVEKKYFEKLKEFK
jgi:hypothetical protein